MSTYSMGSTGSRIRAILLLYFILAGLMSVFVGVVLNQLGKLPPYVGTIAAGISGVVTFIAGAWVLIERFLLPNSPDRKTLPKLSGLTVFSVVVASMITASLMAVILMRLPNSPTPQLTPEQVLTHFCKVVQEKQQAEAYYNDTSSGLRSHISLQQFIADWSGNDRTFFLLLECTPQITSSSDSSVTATVVTQEFYTRQVQTYRFSLIKDSNGDWKIDNYQVQQASSSFSILR
ncbi:MAG TPA: hypothetical protein VF043_29215 [Ktedonobacteraceae bacterium]